MRLFVLWIKIDMSREKKVEKSIDFYKGILSIFVISLFSMIAFLFINTESLSMVKIYILISGIVVMAIAIVIVAFLYFKYLNEMEKL